MTDINFKEKLNPEQYRVMREKDTERPYSGKLWDFSEGGLYSCAACGNTLFSSFTKFDADNGWPAFTDVHGEKSVDLTKTNKGTEVTCQNCHSHVGYLAVRDGAKEDDVYYRVNSAALEFTAFPELPENEEEGDKKKDEKKGKTQMTVQAFLALLASIVVGTGVGYAAGTALCNGGIAVPTASVSPSISSSATPTATPMPSPTPRPSPPTTTPVPTQTPAPTPTPTPLPTTPPASSSSGGGLP